MDEPISASPDELLALTSHGISGAARGELKALLGRGQHLLTVEGMVATLGITPTEAAKKLARWASRGWLRRVRRGLYIPVPVEAENPQLWTEDPLFLADAIWNPCYFTGWTAANHWGLTEQVFRTTVVRTAQRVRASEQHLLEHEYLVAHVPATAIWGTAPLWRNERRIQMADRDRTLVDILAEPSLGGGIRHVADILRAFLSEDRASKLIEYGDRLANGVVFKRLGFLGERSGAEPDLLAACRDRLASGYPLLDPAGPRSGRHDARWGLRINVEIEADSAS